MGILQRSGQVSIEYLILTGFIVVVIILPAIFLLFSTYRGSVTGSINQQKVSELGNGLVNDAEQMYYLGLYSKKTSTYQMPEGVTNMYVAELTDSDGKRHDYLAIIVLSGKGSQRFLFEPKVPLTATGDYVQIPAETEAPTDISECGSMTCSFLVFDKLAITPGAKQFVTETIIQEGVVKAAIIFKVE